MTSEPIVGGGFELTFHHDYPIDGLRGADYNPRFLSDDAFGRLKESLNRWGVVKPVILNKGGTLVAGHQRTKALTALGIETVPAVELSKKVRLHDEINFNLLHNRVEVEASEAWIPARDPGEWELVDPEEIVVGKREGAAFRNAMGQMVAAHGAWGSVVCDDQGRVVLNSEYAVVCADMKVPMLTYTISSQDAAQLYGDLTGEYGVYDWSKVTEDLAPVHNQHYAQLHRLTKRTKGSSSGRLKAGSTIFKSTTWEKKILPWLTKEHRVADFGAGYGDYAKRLRGEGYQVWDYEPFRCIEGAYSIDMREVVRMIRAMERELKRGGQFDVVVLDSVINSITTAEYQEAVLTMCNALLAADGTFVTGTRTLVSKQKAEQGKRQSTKAGHGHTIGFLDEDMVEFKFHKGKWGAQRYHTAETLGALLGRYFGEFELSNTGGSQMYAVCRRPLALPSDQVKRYAEIEFNMPYPNDYRHNRHEGIVAELVRLCAERDAAAR